MKIVKVKKIGEITGFCREYYRREDTGGIIARSVPTEKWPEEWLTCGNKNGGEPEYNFDLTPIKFVIDGGKL